MLIGHAVCLHTDKPYIRKEDKGPALTEKLGFGFGFGLLSSVNAPKCVSSPLIKKGLSLPVHSVMRISQLSHKIVPAL